MSLDASRGVCRRNPVPFAALLALAALSLDHAQEPVEADSAYRGAAALFSLDQVTVVYPSGPGEDLVTNRISAERRAANLDRAHGVRAEIAADAEVSEEQRKGNLLLLGWSNRLLGTDEAPLPFEITEPGIRRIFGEIDAADNLDLLFAHRSPYNPEKLLVFWSRIDLELDRFSVIPFVGSDWVLFDGYRKQHQGMVRKAPEWPVLRNLAAEKQHPPYLPSRTVRSAHYTLHYAEELLEPQAAALVLEARETALAAAIGQLGPPPEGFRIELFIYDNLKHKERWSGVPDPVHSVGRTLELHMTRDAALVANPHEDLHLLAHQRFGACYTSSLFEGLAVSHARSPEELALYAALIMEHDALPSIAELLDEESNRVLNKRRLGFPTAGLFVSWIRATAGTESMARLYKMRQPRVADVARALQLPESGVDAAFETWVSARAEEGQSELRFRQAVAEAKQHRSTGALDDSLAALRRARELRPDDRSTLYKVGVVQLEKQELEAAERTLAELLRLAEADDDLLWIGFANYQMGRLLDDKGLREEALGRYRRALELPDRNGLHKRALAEIERPESAGAD